MAANAATNTRFALYRSVGEVLTQFDVDVETPGKKVQFWLGIIDLTAAAHR